MNPTEIQCTACDDTQTIYSCRAGKSLAVGIPVKCQTKHECRRIAHAVLEAAKESNFEEFSNQILKNVSEVLDIPEEYFREPYSASGEVARYMKEFYRNRSPVDLMAKRITPLPEKYFTDVGNRMFPPGLTDAEREGIETRHLMNGIYRNIVRGRIRQHFNERFIDEVLSKRGLVWNEKDGKGLTPRGVRVTSEMIYDLQYKTEMGETT